MRQLWHFCHQLGVGGYVYVVSCAEGYVFGESFGDCGAVSGVARLSEHLQHGSLHQMRQHFFVSPFLKGFRLHLACGGRGELRQVAHAGHGGVFASSQRAAHRAGYQGFVVGDREAHRHA